MTHCTEIVADKELGHIFFVSSKFWKNFAKERQISALVAPCIAKALGFVQDRLIVIGYLIYI